MTWTSSGSMCHCGWSGSPRVIETWVRSSFGPSYLEIWLACGRCGARIERAMSDFERVRDALSFIPADSPETVLRMGEAIKDGLGDEGFWIWNEWIQKADPSVLAAAGITARRPWGMP